MPQGRIRAIAVGVRGAMTVDWVALTAGIFGSGVAIIALMVMLERGGTTSGTEHDCTPHPEGAESAVVDAPCPE